MLYRVFVSVKSDLTLEIRNKVVGSFTLQSQTEEMTISTIGTFVNAASGDAALKIATKMIEDFASEIALLSDAPIRVIPHSGSVQADIPGASSTLYLTITGKTRIVKPFSGYESKLSKKHARLRKRPLRLYHDGLQAETVFGKFNNFYRVLEVYIREYRDIDAWIVTKRPGTEIKRVKNKDGTYRRMTIYTSIRHRLAHGKTGYPGEQITLSESSSNDLAYVDRYLYDIRSLARMLIQERERF